jgi:hypothetical protein
VSSHEWQTNLQVKDEPLPGSQVLRRTFLFLVVRWHVLRSAKTTAVRLQTRHQISSENQIYRTTICSGFCTICLFSPAVSRSVIVRICGTWGEKTEQRGVVDAADLAIAVEDIVVFMQVTAYKNEVVGCAVIRQSVAL